MSATSKVVLGVSVVLTLSTVTGVHLKQTWDRQRLHEGVVRDLERLERKKENLRLLEEQQSLTRQLEEERLRRATQRPPQEHCGIADGAYVSVHRSDSTVSQLTLRCSG
ncbi:protein PET117 homolog, mitochondrial isoform X2 [Dicentrarchus labrax]|uniref:protein PET117 homolog, mitochondrial isoform X2 n=1 Tax=Dicentrarchus labrax TaxID=13489 RepID=UPI0021F52913|nr:protein PET117 homolog, mitochondrial isoform X2 [Dicentrarchus labrax]